MKVEIGMWVKYIRSHLLHAIHHPPPAIHHPPSAVRRPLSAAHTSALGILFASKAICQCICNVPAASLVGRWGPRTCLCYALVILLISTTGAAIPAGHEYGYMLAAR